VGRTVIVGAGAIGLATAWELSRRGEEVVVVDRHEPGWASSSGNAGWITPSISTPLPAPGLVGASMKWMLRSDSPLYIQPRLDPRFAAWLTRFWRNCSPRAFQAGTAAMAALNDRTMPLFDEWLEHGIDFEMHEKGLLFLGLSREPVERFAESMAYLEQFGYERPKVLNRAELLDIEPHLGAAVASGFHVKEERHIRPETLTSGLVNRLKAEGVEIRSGVNVTGAETWAGAIAGVQTDSGSIAAEKVLIAAGAWTGRVAQRFGVHVPIEAGKGYSITIDNPTHKLSHPLDLIEARAAITPFENSLRLAGTMELSGLNLRVRQERVEAIRRAGDRYLGDWRGGTEKVWVGMRPLTPDGLPVIGQVPGREGLYVAGGHQMLGITMAPATGEVLAELMTTGTSKVDLRAFNPGRFDRRLRQVNSRELAAAS
jgi:D-amino-acid dehydrogenase